MASSSLDRSKRRKLADLGWNIKNDKAERPDDLPGEHVLPVSEDLKGLLLDVGKYN